MVKDTGNPCFDAAYFVLRGDLPLHRSEADMMEEASRVIDACSVSGFLAKPPSVRRTAKAVGVATVTAAAVLGILAGAGVMLLCLA
ncbi:MAG: hypothetical protein E7632_04195 [Ruminococcaceae bacterium]|nr:hypothetical protein [Oscillospiraceae bacterium]